MSVYFDHETRRWKTGHPEPKRSDADKIGELERARLRTLREPGTERISRDGRFRLWRDGLGVFCAEPIDRGPEYVSRIPCTAIPAALLGAIAAPVKEWIGGILHGPTGAGKSWLAVQELIGALRNGPGKFLILPAYLEALRFARFESSSVPGPEKAALEEILTVKHLVVDDLGAESKTDFNLEPISRLIDARSSNNLETLVTSNLTAQEIGRVYGDRILSRLLGRGKVRFLNRDDRRRPPK